MGLGYAHDCIRQGTTSLFAAMDIATDKVNARYRKWRGHQEQFAFRRLLDRKTPNDLCIHVICEDWAARKHATVIAWVAKRRRIHLRCTPTYASWLTRGARRSALLSQRAVKREIFRKVRRQTIDCPQCRGAVLTLLTDLDARRPGRPRSRTVAFCIQNASA